jgi:hypothetical protein
VPDALQTLPGLLFLPPLEPQLIGDFKTRLSDAFTTGTGGSTSEGGVIPFPRAKAKSTKKKRA